MKIYKDTFSKLWIDNETCSAGQYSLSFSSDDLSCIIRNIETQEIKYNGLITNLIKENLSNYSNRLDFETNCSSFFVDAPIEGAGNVDDPLDGVVINLEPGQYLSDVVQTITGATLENPVTINFYNHSKTVNWEAFTEKIHWPQHVYLNFVGKINLWPNAYSPKMGFSEDLLSSNPTDKLFLGFSFDRTNDDSVIKVSGLPENVQKVFFGGLDQSYQIANSYQKLIDTPEDWGETEFGLVKVVGSKDDDARNDALYKKIDGVFIDVTPDFRYVDFSGCDLKLAYFHSANNQGANFESANNQEANFESANNQYVYFGYANNKGANFSYANNQSANWNRIISIENANFKNADLTGGLNLPERINTKAKWIAECGEGNVNAETIWIDGTSILS